MKTVYVTVLALCLLAGFSGRAQAQMAVIDAGAASLMSAMKADQAIYYAQSLMELMNSAQNTYNQFQNMLRAEQRALNNLKGVTNVKNFDDFMRWQNRQLYLEREAEERFMNMGVKIGGKNYRLEDVEKIPDAVKENYVDYWEKEFSEDQRKEMWTRLGLAPSNYVYLTTWQEREKQLAKLIMEKSAMTNEENMKAFASQKEIADRYADDKNKDEDQKIQEKEVLMNLHMTSMDTNRVIREMALDQAQMNELELARRKQELTPPPPPRLSDNWNRDPFGPITNN
jgi:hypothetical protein